MSAFPQKTVSGPRTNVSKIISKKREIPHECRRRDDKIFRRFVMYSYASMSDNSKMDLASVKFGNFCEICLRKQKPSNYEELCRNILTNDSSNEEDS